MVKVFLSGLFSIKCIELTVEDPTAKTTISVIEVTVMATPVQYTMGSKPFRSFTFRIVRQ